MNGETTGGRFRRKQLKSRINSSSSSNTTAILRVDEWTTTMPVRFQQLRSLTVYVRGSVAPGGILGDIVRHCQHLEKVRIERKDNDWDAPDTALELSQEQDMADALRGHPTLQDFALLGVVTHSINHLCAALASLPQLHRVTLSADPQHHSCAAVTSQQQQPPLLSPQALAQLLRHLKQRLCVTGLFPETPEYTRILHEAFVRDARTLHIFVHFSGHNKPSAFAFYIRQVMELNQMGRRRLQEPTDRKNHGNVTMLHLLQFVARRHNGNHTSRAYSMDLAYLLLRENPWLCSRTTKYTTTATAPPIRMPWTHKLHRAVTKIARWRPHAKPWSHDVVVAA